MLPTPTAFCEAFQCFRHAMDVNSGLFQAHLWPAHIRIIMGDIEGALTTKPRALSLKPLCAENLQLRAT